ncbi:MAG: hypothetical protein ACLROI_07260 [Beduini sp.]|uniref:hypothetical protein n=1 Tax=Beduini sp. TaxID=1922300 RepID=UPI0011C8E0AA
MNHTLKKLITVFIFSMMIFVLSGCQSSPKTTAETLQKDVEGMIDKGKNEAKNIGNNLENDVEEAIKYIDTHMQDPFSDYEVTKQMGYYSSYLENIAGTNEEAGNHEIAKLGKNVRSFISNVSGGIESETSEISTGLKNDISTGLGKINEAKDDMVHKFSEMIKNG